MTQFRSLAASAWVGVGVGLGFGFGFGAGFGFGYGQVTGGRLQRLHNVFQVERAQIKLKTRRAKQKYGNAAAPTSFRSGHNGWVNEPRGGVSSKWRDLFFHFWTLSVCRCQHLATSAAGVAILSLFAFGARFCFMPTNKSSGQSESS